MRPVRCIRAVAMATLVGAAGCELAEVTLVDASDIVVAEVYVALSDQPSENTAFAFLHGTGGAVAFGGLDSAVVTLRRTAGGVDTLSLTILGDCVSTLPDDAGGSCFIAGSGFASSVLPGDSLEVGIDLVGGGRITGATRVPGDFTVFVPNVCRLDPDRLSTIRWSASDGAWAYVSETSIAGLSTALAPEGIEADDPLYLLGLSISSTDTEIVFPSELGVFNRFELDQDLGVRLQRGLPDGTASVVAITAADRNYVDWVRGGSFNPSGQIRVSSLDGDGVGVLGATISRRFQMLTQATAGGGTPSCPPGPS